MTATELLAAYAAGQRDFVGANLRWACLSGADLRRADLRWADLRWADLRRADLRWADLRWANLSGADLRWANLRWAVGLGAPVELLARLGIAYESEPAPEVEA